MPLDNILVLSIILVFLTATVGTVARHRRKDRVLKDLEHFHVTAKRHDKADVWGEVEVYSNGLEFLFSEPHKNRRGNLASSCLIYKGEYSEIIGLFRFHDELNNEDKVRRVEQVAAVINKHWYVVLGRKISNFLNTFRDAINESMGMLLKHSNTKSVSTGTGNQLQELSNTATGLLSEAYDPILEQHIGDRVILEQIIDNCKKEYTGVLCDYSDSWISLYDCHLREPISLSLRDQKRLDLLSLIKVNEQTFKDTDNEDRLRISITNISDKLLNLESITMASTANIGVALKPTKTYSYDAPNSASVNARAESMSTPTDSSDSNSLLPEISIELIVDREVDVYLPRSITALRNASIVKDKSR